VQLSLRPGQARKKARTPRGRDLPWQDFKTPSFAIDEPGPHREPLAARQS
jgi:hypothetical protein